MSDKIARLGIERDNDKMYYIKDGDVWAVPRKQKGQPKGKAEKIAPVGLAMDYSRYLYFLDSDGDVARKERALGGGGKKAPKTKVPKAPKIKALSSKPSQPKPSQPSAPAGTSSVPPRTRTPKAPKKSEEQLDREIEECLAKAKKDR